MVLIKLILLSELLNFKSTGFITIMSQVKNLEKLFVAITFLSLKIHLIKVILLKL